MLLNKNDIINNVIIINNYNFKINIIYSYIIIIFKNKFEIR